MNTWKKQGRTIQGSGWGTEDKEMRIQITAGLLSSPIMLQKSAGHVSDREMFVNNS